MAHLQAWHWREEAPPARGTKQGICLDLPICTVRFAHQTVPEDVLWPPGPVGWPCLHLPQGPAFIGNWP